MITASIIRAISKCFILSVSPLLMDLHSKYFPAHPVLKCTLAMYFITSELRDHEEVKIFIVTL
jgi:hypothetical protein